MNDLYSVKAAIHFETWGKHQPNSVNPYAWQGLAYLNLGRYEDAIAAHVVLGRKSDLLPDFEADVSCIQYNNGWAFAQMNMVIESRELFSRVDRNSHLGSATEIWLNWLESSENTLADSALPGFCKTLVPSMKIRVSQK